KSVSGHDHLVPRFHPRRPKRHLKGDGPIDHADAELRFLESGEPLLKPFHPFPVQRTPFARSKHLDQRPFLFLSKHRPPRRRFLPQGLSPQQGQTAHPIASPSFHSEKSRCRLSNPPFQGFPPSGPLFAFQSIRASINGRREKWDANIP